MRDAVIAWDLDPRSVLYHLVDITLESITSERPLFASPLEEPVFYRLFKAWVQGGMDERARMNQSGVQT